MTTKRSNDEGFELHNVPTWNGTTTLSAFYDEHGNLLSLYRLDGRQPTKQDSGKAIALGPLWKNLNDGDKSIEAL